MSDGFVCNMGCLSSFLNPIKKIISITFIVEIDSLYGYIDVFLGVVTKGDPLLRLRSS